MSTIVSIATAVPEFAATQAEVKAALRRLFPLDGRRLDAAMALFDHAQVETRHSVLALPEICRPRTLTETMRIYAENARTLGQRVGRECLRQAGVSAADIDLVITVSCTGVMIPSLDATLIDTLGMRRDVRRLPITELGCFGGASAVARAHDFLRGYPEARVLVISVELPSLSLQSADVSPDSLVSSAIFGDGAAAVLLAGPKAIERKAIERKAMDATPMRQQPTGRTDQPAVNAADLGGTTARPIARMTGVRVLGTLSHTIPASTGALGFDLHDDGFHAVLSKEVPGLLRGVIGELVNRLTANHRLSPSDLSAFVVHPGGKKILGAVEEALGLRREDTQPSWEVLRDYGNQSSASVLFVLERWMSERRPQAGQYGVMAAFGPGLSAELLLLQWL